MAIHFNYNHTNFASESDAQSEVAAMKVRLENNPTDWCVVKRLQDNGDGTWLVGPEKLTDAEINNLTDGNYLIYSVYGGGNEMPLSSAEVAAKVLEYRTEYAQYKDVTKIKKVTVPEDDGEVVVETITPNEDMSGYA